MKPITDEQARILRAAHQRRLVQNMAGRYLILSIPPNTHEKPARPDRKERERLVKRRMLKYRTPDGCEAAYGDGGWWEPTSRGYQALHEWEEAQS